jgi:hypothetical protein
VGATARHWNQPKSYTTNWAHAIRICKILKLKNIYEYGCYVQLYLYDKLASLSSLNMFDSSVKHVRGTRFGSIRRETCMILCGNLLPPLANCYRHSANCFMHLANCFRRSSSCCMHSSSCCMHSVSGCMHSGSGCRL